MIEFEGECNLNDNCTVVGYGLILHVEEIAASASKSRWQRLNSCE